MRATRAAAGLQPQRLSKNLDPTLALPEPSEVISAIAIRSDPCLVSAEFQPDQPQFEALRQKLLEIRGGKPAEDAEGGGTGHHPGGTRAQARRRA